MKRQNPGDATKGRTQDFLTDQKQGVKGKGQEEERLRMISGFFLGWNTCPLRQWTCHVLKFRKRPAWWWEDDCFTVGISCTPFG